MIIMSNHTLDISSDNRKKAEARGVSHSFPRVSVITLTWNHLDYTKKAVNSLIPLLKENDEWILIDNHSTDGTQKYLEALQLPCKKILHLSEENISISQGYNIGLKKAKGRFVLIWDNDLEIVMPETLKHMIGVFKEKPNAGIVQPMMDKVIGKTKLCENPEQLPQRLIFVGVKRTRHFPICPSAAWLISRKCIESVGKFDERFNEYGILDFDYAKRVLMDGYDIITDGFMWVRHHGSITANDYLEPEMLERMQIKFNRKYGYPCLGDPGVPKGGTRR